MLRIGVVGFGGRISSVINRIFKPLREDLAVVGIVDPDEAGARSRLSEADRDNAVFYDDLETMVSKANLDCLFIGTRCNMHTPYAIQAARYDIPLYLEKPVAITLEQATALEEAYTNARCPVVVSFPLRVSPLCEMAKSLIVEGATGSAEHILATNYVTYGTVYWEKPYRDYDITGGLFLQKATHDFDYMSYLMGSPIVRVAAMANFHRVFGGDKPAGLHCSQCDETDTCLESPRNRRLNNPAIDTLEDHHCLFSADCGTPETGTNEDCSSALLEFANGTHGVYTQVFYVRNDAHWRGATVSGYQGTVTFDWFENKLRRIRHHAPFSDTVEAGGDMSHFGGDRALALNFLDVIDGKAESKTPIETGLASVYSCLAARESVATGQFVNVRQVGG